MGALLFYRYFLTTLLAFSLPSRLYWAISMRLSLSTALWVIGCTLLGLSAAASPSSAKVTSNEIRSMVRIEVPALNGKTTITGSGVIIDQDGRFLTAYTAVAKLVKDKGTKMIVCAAKDEVSLPVCNLEATLLKTNTGSNLALLQIKRVLSQGE